MKIFLGLQQLIPHTQGIRREAGILTDTFSLFRMLSPVGEFPAYSDAHHHYPHFCGWGQGVSHVTLTLGVVKVHGFRKKRHERKISGLPPSLPPSLTHSLAPSLPRPSPKRQPNGYVLMTYYNTAPLGAFASHMKVVRGSGV